MHPSELAEILADLAPAEREAIFTTLDEEVAAETLEKSIPNCKNRSSNPSTKSASPTSSKRWTPEPPPICSVSSPTSDPKAILEEMEPEERHEVEELLEFHEESAARPHDHRLRLRRRRGHGRGRRGRRYANTTAIWRP